MTTVLKRETAHLHRRLNTLPNTRILMTPRLRIDEYVRIISTFAQAYNHIEKTLIPLEKTIKLGTLHRYTPRLPSLMQDMASLGGHTAATLPEFGPVTVPLLSQSAAHYFGLRYVIDGSTQGGRFIAERLRKHLPQLAETAFAFWNVQHTASAHWPQLCDTINAIAKTPEGERQMVEAANSAFCAFIECFSFSEACA